jgi:hypothetical protein
MAEDVCPEPCQHVNRNNQTTAVRGQYVANYYDGNTVTAMWNRAKELRAERQLFGTTFCPSHLWSTHPGNTGNVGSRSTARTPTVHRPRRQGRLALISDAARYDD